MSQEIWTQDIDKTVDWGGDITTGGLPVSGEKVQKFIKDALNSKAGEFYADTDNNRYLVFADADDRDTYLSDPVTYAGLLIGAFEAPANFTASITLTSSSYNAIALSDTDNYIDFTWDIVNKNGQSQTSETVIATYTFTQGGVKKTVTEQLPYGTAGHLLIDSYLSEGTNNVTISIIGQNTLAGTSVSATYVVVNLSLTDDFDISTIYNLATNPSATAQINYTIAGTGTKEMQWYLDGELIDRVQNEDEILDTTAERTKYISLANLEQGVHSIAYRAYVKITDTNTYFFSDVLYREVLIYNSEDSSSFVAVKADLPSTYAPSNENDDISNTLELADIEQYVPYTITFAICNPDNEAINVTPVVGTDTYAAMSCSNGSENTFTFTCNTSGSKTITFNVADGTTRDIDATVVETTMDIAELTNDLEISFQADGRNNNSANRSTWTQNGHTATFSGFGWNSTSGWVDGELLINSGSSLSIDITPLTSSATTTGKTLEFEFSTMNVNSDDAVICDLRDSSVSQGLLITASEVSLVSSGGITNGTVTKSVNAKFKSGENVRVSFVINKATGTTNHGLAFVYINGILSGACDFAESDSFASANTLTIAGSADAEISVKQIRFYNRVLTSNEILNNYILYRADASEMRNIYNHNDIYEDDTTIMSMDKIANYLPVMLITGNVPYVDKYAAKSEIIYVDVEYTNLQDPTRSFTAHNIGMSPQGTSSMSYPKRNYRLYTAANKAPYLELYDYQGNRVVDGLYSFKEGAQRVNRWCLKADFAESSGTHNTGVARLWNKVMTDAVVSFNNATDSSNNVTSQTVLRTNAQQAALDSSVDVGDVRTTIDGFPIVCFYRLTENSAPVFMGKYNFNNDKATESVFGFTGIPGFDDSNVECWEVLDSEQDLALFKNVDNWVDNWANAFEGRYPDENTDTTQLYELASWLVGVKNDASTFATEKWYHLDVYKVAAYYVYLMRFGAVDQTVKNAMLTTEDGQHWFFINYDNDTVLGVRNDGLLKYGPTIDRQSMDNELNIYCYAGHDSTLWNRLEADSEFMSIVRAVDDALFKAGLSYDNTLDMFETKQSDQWCERIYNQDAQYKYVDPYVNDDQNYLSSMQGSRKTHRRWWLARRFSLYDSMFANSNYTSNQVYLLAPGAPQDTSFFVVAGYDMYYGYGIQSNPVEVGVYLNEDDVHEFSIDRNLAIGTPLRIYAAYTLKALDISMFGSYLSVLNLTNAVSETEGSAMKYLIIGDPENVNTGLTSISGLSGLTMLEELDITNMQALTSVDVASLTNLTGLYAINSGLTSVTFADSGKLAIANLPGTLRTINISNNPNISFEDISFDPDCYNLNNITVSNCPVLSADGAWFADWAENKTTADSNCTLNVDNIDWTLTYNEFLAIAQIAENDGNLNLRGHVYLNESLTLDQISTLSSIFGSDCFETTKSFYITFIYDDIASITLTASKNIMKNGDSVTITAAYSGNNLSRFNWSLSDNTNLSMTTTATSAVLTSGDSFDSLSNVTVTFTITKMDHTTVSATTTLSIIPFTFCIDNTEISEYSIDMGYGSNDSSMTLSDGWTITCNNQSVSFAISSVSVEGGYATYSGNTITSITKTTLSNGGSYDCSVVLLINSTEQLTCTFTINTTLVSLTIDDISDIQAKNGSGSGNVTFSYPAAYASDITVVSASVSSGNTNTVSNLTIDGCTITVSGYSSSASKVLTLTYKINNGNNCTTTKNFNVAYVETGATLRIGYNNLTSSGNGFTCNVFTSNSGFCGWPTSNGVYLEQNSCSIEYGSNTYTLTWDSTNQQYHYESNGTDLITLRTTLFIHNDIYNAEYTAYVNLELAGNYNFDDFRYAFYANTCIISAEIYDCSTISNYAFYNCSRLTSLVIGSEITLVKSYSFYNCTQLNSITSYAITAPSISNNTFCNVKQGGTLTYPEGSDYSTWLSESSYYLGYYKWNMTVVTDGTLIYTLKTDGTGSVKANSSNEPTGELIIPSTYTYDDTTYTITKLEQSAFSTCTGLTSVVIPDSVTSIGSSAFYYCTGLTSISLGSGVTSIDNLAGLNYLGNQWNNSKLSSISISSNNTKYNDGNGSNCIIDTASNTLLIGCSNTVIPNSVTSIGNYAFKYMNITSLTIPNSVTSIGVETFEQCKNLTSITIPDSVTSISSNAFLSCTSLTSIVIPDSVTSLGTGIFQNCTALSDITLPNNITTIPSYTFNYCSQLTSITIPDSVTSIDSEVFNYCSRLTSITIPSNVTNIGTNTFIGCKKLSTITINCSTAPTIQSNTWGTGSSTAGYSSGTSNVLYVPEGATGYDTSNWTNYLLNESYGKFTLSATL